jgi:hypothetical protein
MLKATHKGRATTLSKTLLTAGLLGGAALSTLGAGSAQAAWDLHEPLGYICSIAPTMGGAACAKSPAPDATTPTTVARTIPQFPGETTHPHDKLLTLLDWNGLAADDTISFVYQSDKIWQFRFDPSLNIADTMNPIGNIDYKIKITDPYYIFETATLSTLLGANGDYTVTKKFYTDHTFTTEIDGGAWSLENPSTPDMKTIGGQEIFVRDSWSIPSGSTANVDVIQNDYTQVPAPLPLLGVGAAFGSIRKLRKFSSQLKTFSMG